MDALAETASPSEDATLNLTAEELLDSLENHEDVVSWINDILDVDEALASAPATQPTALVDLDRRVTQLVGTIELASEDTTTQVERLIDDISRGASRLTYDLHFMREGALSLQALLHNVEAKSKASVAADTNAALDRLHFLDTVKRNMEAAREVLKEAESWSTLESDVISLLGEQAYERAAERLSEASKSMVVFEGTPEYDARRTLMVSLQNQLEAALSSALVAAVNSQDVAVCRNYFAIFCNIQRESEFRNYYYGSRKAALLELWQHARLRDCEHEAADAPTFAQFLPTFFQAFLAMLATERTAISAIFPDPQHTLSTLITSTLSSLQPSFPERLSAVAGHHGARALPQLIAAYQATQEFALATDRILEKIGFASQPAPTPGESDGSQNKGHLRRRSSTRMSMSRRIGPHRASISGHPLTNPVDASQPTWDQELFEPFLDFQNDYGSWERRYLKDALREIMREEPGSSQDRARLIRERSVDVFSAADEAISRCLAFTHGYAVAGLVDALDTLLRTFVDNSKAEVSSAQSSLANPMASASGDLSDLDYTPKDWADIQSLLHTLEAIRDLHDRVLKFEAKLRGSLVQVSHTFRLMRADPTGLHISGTTRGAVRLLAQSSLNSMELHDLLERVDPDPLNTQSQSRGDPFLTPTPPASGAEARRPSQVFHLTPGAAQAAPLLVASREAISGFAKACQVALQETILSPLRKRLVGYPSLAVWVAQADAKRRAGAAAGSALSEVHVPTFSLSPTDTMQRVAEGLLNLPRLFEVYADDDALAFSLETLPFIKADMLKALAEPAPEAAAPAHHSRRTSSLSLKTPPVLAAPAPELTPEAVSAAWLSSLGLSLLAHLTAKVLPGIRFLSASGAAQLASDLGYLSSIVMALNIEDPELDKWKEYVELDDAAGRERLKGEDAAGDAVLATVARLRGWTAS